jgi:hypothetical protein
MHVQINGSALGAFAFGMAEIAHDIANTKTEAHRSRSYNYHTGPAGQGDHAITSANSFVPVQDYTYDVRPLSAIHNYFGSSAPSATDVAAEVLRIIRTELSFLQNARMIRNYDELEGIVVDHKV